MNCKPGDLAIIVRALPGSPNLGRLVRVIEAQTTNLLDGRIWQVSGDPCWIVESVGSQLAVFSGNPGAPKLTRWATRRPVRDANLRPIRGDNGGRKKRATEELERVQ